MLSAGQRTEHLTRWRDGICTRSHNRNGDRTSWDQCPLMIWDNFPIFRTYQIRGKITECWVFSITRARLVIMQEGLITWSWLAEHACIELVSLQADFEKDSETHRFWVCIASPLSETLWFHLNSKENRNAADRSFLMDKHNDFSIQKCTDSQPERSLSRDDWCCRSIESQNFIAAKQSKFRCCFFGSLY